MTLRLNQIIIPHKDSKAPNSGTKFDWNAIQNKTSYKSSKEMQEAIVSISIACNKNYPRRKRESEAEFTVIIEEFEKGLETEIKNAINEINSYNVEYSDNQKKVLEELKIRINSKKFECVKIIFNTSKYNFFDRCILYYKVKEWSNSLDKNQLQTIINAINKVNTHNESSYDYIDYYGCAPFPNLSSEGLFNLLGSIINSNWRSSGEKSTKYPSYNSITYDNATYNDKKDNLDSSFIDYFINFLGSNNSNSTNDESKEQMQEFALDLLKNHVYLISKDDNFSNKIYPATKLFLTSKNILNKEITIALSKDCKMPHFGQVKCVNNSKFQEQFGKLLQEYDLTLLHSKYDTHEIFLDNNGNAEVNIINNDMSHLIMPLSVVFIKSFLDEIIEDQKLKIVLTAAFFISTSYSSLLYNVCYFGFNTVCNIAVQKIVSYCNLNSENATILNAAFNTIFKEIGSGSFWNLERHAENVSLNGLHCAASDCGLEMGRYVCNKIGGKIKICEKISSLVSKKNSDTKHRDACDIKRKNKLGCTLM